MKKFIFGFLFSIVALAVNAQSSLKVSAEDLIPGQDEQVLTLELNNADGTWYTAATLVLPEGISLCDDAVEAGSAISGRGNTCTIESEQKSANEVRIVVYSGKKTAIKSGVIANVYVNVASTYQSGVFAIKNTQFNVTEEYSVDDASFAFGSCSRTTSTDKYGTICLPSAFTVEGAKVYSAAVAGSYAVLTEVEETVAGVAYIYEATADAQTFTLTGEAVAAPVEGNALVGQFVAAKVPVGSYVLQTKEGVQSFNKVNGELTLGANKAYINAPASTAKELNINYDGEATAIETVNALIDGNAQIFDVAGRKLMGLQKGINIVNGKALIVK